MRQWQCSVCGYIHNGDEPPEKCPVCGADKSKFTEVFSEQSVKPKTDVREMISINKTTAVKVYHLITDLMVKQHAHPVSVHIPNGVLPVSVLFVILGAVFQFTHLQLAAFYNMIFVVIAMPMVLFSGYADWQKRYNGTVTPVFITKMVCGVLVTLIALILVIWQAIDPNAAGSASRSGFVFLHILMLAAAAVAGFLGGKLVFKD